MLLQCTRSEGTALNMQFPTLLMHVSQVWALEVTVAEPLGCCLNVLGIVFFLRICIFLLQMAFFNKYSSVFGAPGKSGQKRSFLRF